MRSRVLILFAHPALHKSRVNRRLIASVRGLDNVTINDLYEEYPTFDINVGREQELLLAHDVIVFQHPFYWYSSPAILKEWEDLVLEYGFAYGTGGTKLQGKLFLTAITTGAPPEAYCRTGFNCFTIRQLLAPFEQTAKFCGMRYLSPFVVHSALGFRNEKEIQAKAQAYRHVIEGLRDGLLDPDEVEKHARINEAPSAVGLQDPG
jgi:glutathione-regulated potassium-efflux system ancillary protein KefG